QGVAHVGDGLQSLNSSGKQTISGFEKSLFLICGFESYQALGQLSVGMREILETAPQSVAQLLDWIGSRLHRAGSRWSRAGDDQQKKREQAFPVCVQRRRP